jgi:ABC-type multidrug transport system fused ATPase/permease subunit
MNDAASIPAPVHLDAARKVAPCVRGARESDRAASHCAGHSAARIKPQPGARPASRAPWRFALRRLARHKGSFTLALFWSVVFILVPMQVPVITGALIDSLRAKHAHLYGLALDPNSRRRNVKIAALALLGVALAHGVSAYLRQLSINKLTRRFVCETRQELIQRLTTMPLERHFQYGAAELCHRVISDTATLRSFADQVVIRTVTNALRVAFPVTLLFLRQPLLAAVVCAPIPLQWALTSYMQKKAHRARIRARQTRLRFVTVVKEQLDGVETIQGLGACQVALNRAMHEAEDLEREQLVQADCEAMKSAAIWAMTSLGFALVWGLGGLRVHHGDMTVGELVSFAGLLAFAYAPFRRFAGAVGASKKILMSLEHVQELMDLPASPPELPGARPLALTEGRIELRDVSFAYDSQPVLRNVQLVVPPCSLTAITGPSGAGKSTLLRLINRLYDSLDGQVLIDGRNVREFTVASLRSTVVLVPQRAVFFTGSIADNLRLARPEASEGELLAACGAADLLGLVRRLKDGLHTRLGQGGAQLSGGEAQRLAIARAVLMRPKVLLLDEPTAALDLRCQAAIMDTLGRLKAQMTIVVAGHRLEALRHADRLVILDQGRIVAQGAPASVLSSAEIYESVFPRAHDPERPQPKPDGEVPRAFNGREHSAPCLLEKV